MIGICYDDEYSVAETFQLLKIPWEWYNPFARYDVVISRHENVAPGTNIIDLNKDDFFRKIADLLNNGIDHGREPVCDQYIEALRNQLKNHTTLIEIPPHPVGIRVRTGTHPRRRRTFN